MMTLDLNTTVALITAIFAIFHVLQYLGLRDNTRALREFSNALLMLQSEKRSSTSEIAHGLQRVIESCERQEEALAQIRARLGTRGGDYDGRN